MHALWILALLLSTFSPANAAPLFLVHLSDTHETLSEIVDDQGTPRSLFLSRTAAAIENVRIAHPGSEVIVVHAGDWIAPSIASRALSGQDIVARLNHLGTTVAAVGNHDFDLGAEAFRDAVTAAHFPVVTANVAGLSDVGVTVPTHHVFVTAEKKRIAFVSVVTGDLQRVFDKFGLPLRVEPFAERLGHVVRRIKSEHEADYVVALTHLERAEDHEVLKTIPEIDLTLGGHEHELYAEQVHGRRLVKAGADGTSLNVIEIRFDETPARVEVTPVSLNQVSERTESLAQLEERTLAVLRDRRADKITTLNETLDGTWARLAAEGRLTSPRLGTWVAEVMRKGLGADAALMNVGLISRSNRVYGRGPLTRGDLEDILPWFDPMIVIETDRTSLERGLTEMLKKTVGREWSGDTPIFAGFEASWEASDLHGPVLRMGASPRALTLAINLYLFRSLENVLTVTRFERAPTSALGEMEAMANGLGCAASLGETGPSNVRRP